MNNNNTYYFGLLKEIYYQALTSVDPLKFIPQFITVKNNRIIINKNSYRIDRLDRIVVIATGKASISMSYGFESAANTVNFEGLAITKYGHYKQNEFPLQKIKVIESSHPYPDQNSLEAGSEMIRLLENLTENSLVVFLISGGTSSLVECLKNEFTLNDLQELNRRVVNSGVEIKLINEQRKIISLIKDGGILNFAYPAKVESLILSDVIGNDLKTIGSGMTVLSDNTSVVISGFYESNLSNTICADNNTLINSAIAYAEKSNYKIINLGSFTENILNVSTRISKTILEELAYLKSFNKLLFIGGGEATLEVKGNGKGGRSQELALRFIQTVKDFNPKIGVYALFSGSDGTDGPTDAAGGFATNKINISDNELELSLENNDSYNLLKKHGLLFKTGPTNTNVCDVFLIMIINE